MFVARHPGDPIDSATILRALADAGLIPHRSNRVTLALERGKPAALSLDFTPQGNALAFGSLLADALRPAGNAGETAPGSTGDGPGTLQTPSVPSLSTR